MRHKVFFPLIFKFSISFTQCTHARTYIRVRTYQPRYNRGIRKTRLARRALAVRSARCCSGA